MMNITLQKQHCILWHFIPRLALSAVIIGVTLWGGSISVVVGAGFSAPTLAISLGIVLGSITYPHIWKSCNGGALLTKQYLLRLGIILYGFRLTLSQIAGVGISGIIIDTLTLSSTSLLVCFLGQKVFSPDKHIGWLIGAGSSICGAVAALAIESAVKAEVSKVTVAVVATAVFRIAVVFLYPAIYPLMSQRFSPGTSGIYTGSTMHEVAQMVAIDHATSPGAGNAAVIPKTLRVMMLAPFLTLLVARARQLSGANSGEKNKITIPWFVISLIVVATLNSFRPSPQDVVNILATLNTFLLAMVMAVPDLTTHVSTLERAGTKPLSMALVLLAWLIVGGGTINYVIQNVIAQTTTFCSRQPAIITVLLQRV